MLGIQRSWTLISVKGAAERLQSSQQGGKAGRQTSVLSPLAILGVPHPALEEGSSPDSPPKNVSPQSVLDAYSLVDSRPNQLTLQNNPQQNILWNMRCLPLGSGGQVEAVVHGHNQVPEHTPLVWERANFRAISTPMCILFMQHCKVKTVTPS